MPELTKSQKDYMFALESKACKVVTDSLKRAKWTVHAFDWFPVFSICKRYDLYEENTTLWKESHELYRPSRPDFLAKSPYDHKCLLEVKGKSKHDLIVDDYKYDSYIYWERFFGIPVFIVFYVDSESGNDQTGLYLHKVQDTDIRFGEIRYGGKALVTTENRWNTDANMCHIEKEDKLAKELSRQIRKWNPLNSFNRWKERKGIDLTMDSNVRYLP